MFFKQVANACTQTGHRKPKGGEEVCGQMWYTEPAGLAYNVIVAAQNCQSVSLSSTTDSVY